MAATVRGAENSASKTASVAAVADGTRCSTKNSWLPDTNVAGELLLDDSGIGTNASGASRCPWGLLAGGLPDGVSGRTPSGGGGELERECGCGLGRESECELRSIAGGASPSPLPIPRGLAAKNSPVCLMGRGAAWWAACALNSTELESSPQP